MSMNPVEAQFPAGAERSHLRYILAIAALARLVLTVVCFHHSPVPPLSSWGYENIAIAMSLHSGHGYSSPFFIPSGPTAILPPIYPLLIALAIAIFGTGPAAATMILAFQIALSLLTIPVVMYTARSHFGVRTANFAGFLCAICAPIFFQSMLIWDTTLCALLLVTALAIAPRVTWSRTQSAAVGAACALATLINPSLLPSLIAVFAWSSWRRRRMPWLAVVTFLLALSPWPVRNAALLHSFIPFRSNFGYELWAGNHPGTNGEFSKYDTPIYNFAELQQYLSTGEVAYMHEKAALARSFIRAHPREFLRFSALRFIRFWMGTSKSAASPASPALSVLAWIGLALLWRSKQRFTLFALPLAVYPPLYYLTHADARFLSVLGPVLAILAAHACESFLARLAPQGNAEPQPIAAKHAGIHSTASATFVSCTVPN